MCKASAEEEIIYADIDLDHLTAIRNQIPISFQQRSDLYAVRELANDFEKQWEPLDAIT